MQRSSRSCCWVAGGQPGNKRALYDADRHDDDDGDHSDHSNGGNGDHSDHSNGGNGDHSDHSNGDHGDHSDHSNGDHSDHSNGDHSDHSNGDHGTAPATTAPVPDTTGTPTEAATPAATDAPTAATTTAAPTTTTATTATATPETAVSLSGAAGVGDSLYPQLGNRGYDALHYDIELDVDPEANTITGLTTVEALATENLATFNLDFSGLEVHKVTVDGNEAEFSRSDTELTVQPAVALASGQEFSTGVSYSGAPDPVADPGVPFFTPGWQSRDGVIFTANQPSGSMTWFPSNNHPVDKATFEIRVTVPSSTTAAATGILSDETTAAGRTTSTWIMSDPMATYLAAVYIGDFERIDGGQLDSDGPLIRDYVPADAPREVIQALSVTPEALRFLEDRLGPYPFDAYGTIVMPFSLGFALENQTLSLHGPGVIGPGFIAHEAAHQWLGNSVALQDWSDIWLNEGFATYLHMMFEAEHFGTDFDAQMQQLHRQLPHITNVVPKRISVEELFDNSVYVRGAMTLHALRLHAGDDVFFTILRAHYDRSAGDTTNTAEFLAIVDEFAGSDAVDLVESWLYDETTPATLPGSP